MTASPRIRVLYDEDTIARRNESLAREIAGSRPQNLLVVAILRDVESDVRGRDVLLVDDILESGRTVTFAKDLLMARGARRVMTAVLLEKPGKRAVSIDADFVGFTCPDVFVVGYGMDVDHSYRQLPFVGLVDHLDREPDLFGGT